jgi:cytosine/uracil/thiamine/allantoin permease
MHFQFEDIVIDNYTNPRKQTFYFYLLNLQTKTKTKKTLLMLFYFYHHLQLQVSHISIGKQKVIFSHFIFLSEFSSSLTANISCWATKALSIPDFTRHVKSQNDKVISHLIYKTDID